MFNGKKVVVVMPAYNAEKTLEKTFREVAAQPFVDQVVIVDDASSDDTWAAASRIEGAVTCRLPRNRPVAIGSSPRTTMFVLSDFILEVTAPAPMWAL